MTISLAHIASFTLTFPHEHTPNPSRGRAVCHAARDRGQGRDEADRVGAHAQSDRADLDPGAEHQAAGRPPRGPDRRRHLQTPRPARAKIRRPAPPGAAERPAPADIRLAAAADHPRHDRIFRDARQRAARPRDGGADAGGAGGVRPADPLALPDVRVAPPPALALPPRRRRPRPPKPPKPPMPRWPHDHRRRDRYGFYIGPPPMLGAASPLRAPRKKSS